MRLLQVPEATLWEALHGCHWHSPTNWFLVAAFGLFTLGAPGLPLHSTAQVTILQIAMPLLNAFNGSKLLWDRKAFTAVGLCAVVRVAQ